MILCQGINCPKYNGRCIAYGDIPYDCPLGYSAKAPCENFGDDSCLRNCCNMRADKAYSAGFKKALEEMRDAHVG